MHIASNESSAGLENCTYFLSGNFNDRNKLSRKLNQLISKITKEVQQRSNIIESTVETDFEKSTLQTTYSAKGKIIEVNTKFNVTEMSTETGTIVKCVKGNHWWLLVFTTPLLIYSALIYPIKNCKDKRKDHLRGLLMAKKD